VSDHNKEYHSQNNLGDTLSERNGQAKSWQGPLSWSKLFYWRWICL